MRKVVTGEQLAQVYNPDPFARPVWRAPVYQTPAAIIALVQLVRLLAWLVRLAARHPVATALVALLVFIWVNTGWAGLVALVLAVGALLAVWRYCWPLSFARWVATPARGRWRAWCYRRRWAAVLMIADLAPWYRGR